MPPQPASAPNAGAADFTGTFQMPGPDEGKSENGLFGKLKKMFNKKEGDAAPNPAGMPNGAPVPNPIGMPMPEGMPQAAQRPSKSKKKGAAPAPMPMPNPAPMPNAMPMPNPAPMPNAMPMPNPAPMPAQPAPAPMPAQPAPMPAQPASAPMPAQPAPAPAGAPVQPPTQPYITNEGPKTVLLDPSQADDRTVRMAEFCLIRSKDQSRIRLEKPLIRVGRNRDDIDINLPENLHIGHMHATLLLVGGSYSVIDNDSANHTYVNHARLEPQKQYPLKDGDRISFADEEFEFRIGM
jgi:pSer/pThr/pTyr-binding forkhead associated (FHA) protein